MKAQLATLLSALALVAFAQAPPGFPSTTPAGPVPLPPVIANSTAAASLWRRVLAMSQEQREAFIAGKPAAWQAWLRSKAQEYLSLSPQEQEARLAALELRAMLLPLMKMPAESRARHLQGLPEDKRRDIEHRLMTWDILPPPLQKELLENESTIHLLVEAGTTNISREQLLSGVLPARRIQAEKELDYWNSLPAERREQMVQSFNRYFVEAPQERNKTLRNLKDQEKAAVAQFEKMPEQQRSLALDGFKKYKSLSASEQQDFLRAAARWQAMSEKERQLWRQLAPNLRQRLQSTPPLPPPPMPHPAVLRR